MNTRAENRHFSLHALLLMQCANLYPIIFQDYGRRISDYTFERDVLFVRRELLSKVLVQQQLFFRLISERKDWGCSGEPK